MHLNYHFLKHLVRELKPTLRGARFDACYSQSKDELILQLDTESGTKYIKALLSGSFSCLTFPEDHHRAKRNSADIFPEIIGKSIESIRLTENDRSFIIELNSGLSILFKLHGNRSNIILFQNGDFISLFNSSLKKDKEANVASLSKQGIAAKGEWLTNPNLRSAFPTFGPRVNEYLKLKGFETAGYEEQWTMIAGLLAQMQLNCFFINEDGSAPFLSFFKQGNVLSQHTEAIAATNSLSKYYHQTYLFERDKAQQLQRLKSSYQKTEKYIAHTRQKMDSFLSKRPFDEIANIIMANLHAIPKGASKVELLDFYSNETIEIKLKATSTPQKQAEQYYRKSKNQSKEKDNLELSLKKKKGELDNLEQLINELTAISGRKTLDQFIKSQQAGKQDNPSEQRLPYYRYDIEGFEVRIGKSAKDNDLMLRQFAHKDDLWLHARDVAGSHVLIKHKKNVAIKPSLIEQVAQLAAYYSKRKHDSLAPVIYTPRKYVRKAKNLLPGQVLVEKEQVVLVKPSKESNLSH